MRKVIVACVVVALAAVLLWAAMIRMPGRSFTGRAATLNQAQTKLRDELAADVRMLGGEIGERNVPHYPKLHEAADYIERAFTASGLHVRRDSYNVGAHLCDNIEASVAGSGEEIVVIGAHYDSVFGSPGANDNGSGIAALLALARRFADAKPNRTLRFVAFANEEPPYFLGETMGSLVYARRCKERRDRIAAMISLETIAYFSNAPHSQRYPLPGLGAFYPTRGNFIGFVANVGSRKLLRQVIGSFRAHAQIACEGAALPAAVPGVGWSDHWSFWQCGYPAMMVTDTAPFRYPHYHSPTDTPDKLDYDSMALVVDGLQNVVRDLAAQ